MRKDLKDLWSLTEPYVRDAGFDLFPVAFIPPGDPLCVVAFSLRSVIEVVRHVLEDFTMAHCVNQADQPSLKRVRLFTAGYLLAYVK